MKYRILGPLEARADGVVRDLGTPKQRALLGVLALHTGDIVSTSRLIDALWGEDPPRTASHSIQTYVSGLRVALGSEAIVTQAPGYRLAADSESVDALRFERMVATGRQALEDGRASEAAGLLGEALELWRGEPLADVLDQLTDLPEVRRLAELRLTARERWVDAELALGRAAALVPELERLTQAHPLREPLWERWMLALYRSGRPAEALRVYQDLRRLLGEELGVEPSERLQRLEEQILLQDPHLGAERREAAVSSGDVRNPYKGLRPFGREDAADFFGRSELVRRLLEAVADPARRLVAIVGPSGSGKSSVLRAGLIPAVLEGRLPGSEQWAAVLSLPGPRPLSDLAGAIREVMPGLPEDLETRMRRDGPASALAEVDRPLLLAVDQFEEVFTLASEDERRIFLDGLADLAGDTGSRVALVVSLRADFYDRPLLHPRFGRLVAGGTVQVMPMDPAELEEAAERPAASVGVGLEPALVAALAADLADQPGALPQFQYALTELFERRRGDMLTLEGYRAIGGVEGALSRRAEEIFATFDADEQTAAAQLALRLIAPAGQGGDTRRRVPASEVASLDVDPVAMQTVMERMGRHRLLSFDRDPGDGHATVELAHEALIGGWDRLHRWVEQARQDLRIHDALVAAMSEWERSGEDSGYLLTGSRLDEYEDWADGSSMRLTADERRFLDACLTRRDAERAFEEARRSEREALSRRASRRLWAGVAAALVAVAAIVVLVVALLPKGPKVALIYEGRDTSAFGGLMALGLDRAADTFDIRPREIEVFVNPADDVAQLCRSGYGLIVLGGGMYVSALEAAPECQDSILVLLDSGTGEAESCTEALAGGWEQSVVESICAVTVLQDTASQEGSFLAGAAAGLSTETGTVGFVGGMPGPLIEAFRAGYLAGVEAVAPEVEVLSVYVSYIPDTNLAFQNPGGGRGAAERLYWEGADIVYHAAGASGTGVLEAAVDLSGDLGRKLWMIGVDQDEFLRRDITDVERDHVLTSMWKRFDVLVFDAVDRFLAGELTPGEVWVTGLADRVVDVSSEGGFIDEHLGRLEELRGQILTGEIEVPAVSDAPVLPPPAVSASATIVYDGATCSWRGPTTVREGDVIAVDVRNDFFGMAIFAGANVIGEIPEVATGEDQDQGVLFDTASVVMVPPLTTTTFYLFPQEGSYSVVCKPSEDLTLKAAQFDVLPAD